MVRNNLVTGWLSDSIVTLDHRLRGLEIGALDSVSKPFKAGAVNRLRAQRPLCGLAQVNDLTVQRSRCSPLRLTRGLKQQPTPAAANATRRQLFWGFIWTCCTNRRIAGMRTPLHISAAAGRKQLRQTIAASVSIRAVHSAWMGAESLILQKIIDSSWVLLRRPAPAGANPGVPE